jgi:hypothetical protein
MYREQLEGGRLAKEEQGCLSHTEHSCKREGSSVYGPDPRRKIRYAVLTGSTCKTEGHQQQGVIGERGSG